MTSIRDVAKRAEVGATTVSRYLNENGYVSEESRNKIKEAIKELDYTPNELARNLYRKKSGIVAVLVPDSAHPFFSEFVCHTEMELYKYGYKTMLCNTIRENDREREFLDMLKRQMVDGIITGVHTLKDVEKYAGINRPIVALDRYLSERIPIVAVDHKRGGALAAHKLIDKGCKKVMQFQGNLDVNTPSHDRHFEFTRIMKEHGITLIAYTMAWNRFDRNYYEKIVYEAFQEYPDVDGVFGTDLIAANYLKIALQQGMRVPEDLKIIAYDGTYITNITQPKLTTIVQPIERLAQETAKLMVKRIKGKEYKDKKVMLNIILKEGQTT